MRLARALLTATVLGSCVAQEVDACDDDDDDCLSEDFAQALCLHLVCDDADEFAWDGLDDCTDDVLQAIEASGCVQQAGTPAVSDCADALWSTECGDLPETFSDSCSRFISCL
jgi:hypothetical protein